MQTHTLKPGETLGSLARKYHVDVKELIAWNGIKNPESLRDGTKLLIPTTKTAVKIAPAAKTSSTVNHAANKKSEGREVTARYTMYRHASIKGDRISVRTAPGTENKRIEMFDNGTPMIVTAEREGWAQVEMPNGKTGWTMLSYLKVGGTKTKQSTRTAETSKPKTIKHIAKWTPAKPAAKKHIAKAASKQGKHAAKIASEKIWKAEYAKHVAEARQRAKHKKALAKIVRSSPRYAFSGKRSTPEAAMPEASTDLVRSAYSYRGTPYRWGGSAKGGFDCSGFTSYLYRQQGVNLPHSARAQATMGQKVEKSNLKSGDLVFFHTVTPGISHVGMYVGDGKFVHASSRRSGGVRVDSLNSGYYSQRLRGARRYSK